MEENRNVLLHKKLEDYKKRYSKCSDKLLIISQKEVEAFDKKDREYKYKDKNLSLEKNLILKNNKWWLIEDKYYQIPKAFTPTWFKTLTPGGKVASGAVAALLVGGIVTISALAINKGIRYKSDIDRVNEINEKIDKSKIRTAYDFVNTYNCDLSTLKAENPDNEYAFDVKNKQVVIISKKSNEVSYAKEKIGNKSDIFRFKDEYTFEDRPNVDTYSTYLSSNYKGSKKITFNSGLDVGANKDMELTYSRNINDFATRSLSTVNLTEDNTNAAYVPMVVTNYGSLNISSSYNSIAHYGILNSLTVSSYKSFDEYGTVAGNAILKSGTFKAQEDSVVNTIIIESANVKVEVSVDNEYVGTIAATNLDYITGESVVIPEEKKEEIVVKKDESIDPPSKDDLQGLGSEESPYIIDNFINQASKITDKYEVGFKHFRYAGSEKEIDCSNWAYNGKSICLNGTFDCNNITLNNLDCSFIEVLGSPDYTSEEYVNKISNLTINASINQSKATGAVVRSCGVRAELDNITVHGNVLAGGASAFVGYGCNNVLWPGTGSMFLTFKNCYSDANLICTSGAQGTNGAFIHHPFCDPENSLITISDSIFTGTISYPNLERLTPSYARYIGSGAQNYIHVKTSYSYAFTSKYCNPEGTLYETPTGKDPDGSFYAGTHVPEEHKDAKCNDKYLATSKISTIEYENKGEIKQATSESDLANFSTTKKANAVYAKAALFISPNDKNGSGTYLKSFLDEDINISSLKENDTFDTSIIKNYKIRVNKRTDETTYVEEGIHGYEYNVSDKGEFYYVPAVGSETKEVGEYTGAYVSITQFDENGNLVCIDHFDLVV